VALPGENGSPLVPFTFRADESTFVVEQFWGRAVQASCNSKEFRALFSLREWKCGCLAHVDAGISPVLAFGFELKLRNDDRGPVDRITFHCRQCLVGLIQREGGHFGMHANGSRNS